MRTAKSLIRLGGCPGWSVSSLSAQPFCWFCHVAAQIYYTWATENSWQHPWLDYRKSGEPRRDKTNKMSVRPANTQISLGIRPVWSESSLSAWRKLGFLATQWAHSEDWSDWADAQADLSLRWAHNHFVGFVMSWLKFMSVVTVDKTHSSWNDPRLEF